MSRFRTAITWAVLGFFAATMVCGEALHCLCGISHCPHASGVCDCHAGRDHACDSADSGAPAVGRATDHAGGASAESDCPICSFFAQAHGLPIHALAPSESFGISGTVPALHCRASSSTVPVYRSRAPPS